MIRKDFIRTASILLGSSVLPLDFVKDLRSSSTTLKKGIGYAMIKEDLSVLDKFKLVKDLGFDGIEINSPTDLNIKELVYAVEQTGVTIPSTVNKDHWAVPLCSNDPLVRQQIIQSIGDSLEQTKILGGDTVLVVPGVVNENMSYERAYNNTLIAVQELIPLVEKTGVKIGFENVWNNFIISPIEAKQFLEEINHPLIGWYFDIGNVMRYGWPEHWLETLDDKVFKLHAKEFSITKMNNEGLRKGFNVEFGEGDINWSNVMQKIRDINYGGEWVTLELGAGDRAYLQGLSTKLDFIINN